MAFPVRGFVVALLALVIAAGAGGGSLTPAVSAQTAAGQTLLGLNTPSLPELDRAESAIGARAAIVGTFADWQHTPDFPRGLAGEISERGAVPLISWEPWDSERGGADQPEYALRGVAAGNHDALIDRWAAEVARYERPVMLRFAPEMNGDWLPWSTGVNGNRPGDYVAAWRHVRSRFRRAGAGNAIWVWNPIAAYEGSTPLRTLFPGAREVDWVAVDGYNWGAARAWGWQTQADIFGPTLRAFRALAPSRPVMIAEIGCAPDERKANWATQALTAAHDEGVAAVVWFEFNKETDWRLSATSSVARAAGRVVHGPGWRLGGDRQAVERDVTAGSRAG
jgi:beta-mannanase